MDVDQILLLEVVDSFVPKVFENLVLILFDERVFKLIKRRRVSIYRLMLLNPYHSVCAFINNHLRVFNLIT